jgi:hypothetical protein
MLFASPHETPKQKHFAVEKAAATRCSHLSDFFFPQLTKKLNDKTT